MLTQLILPHFALLVSYSADACGRSDRQGYTGLRLVYQLLHTFRRSYVAQQGRKPGLRHESLWHGKWDTKSLDKKPTQMVISQVVRQSG